MSSRAEDDESVIRENRIQTAFGDKSATGSLVRHKNEPKKVPYEWDSLIEHSIMEPPCICSASNTSVQHLGLSWVQDDDSSDDEDETFSLKEFPEKKSQSVLSDIKKTPFPLGRSTNLNYYDDKRDIEDEAEERNHEGPTKRDPPPGNETSEVADEGQKENSGCDAEIVSAEKKKPTLENIAAESKVATYAKKVDAPPVSATVLLEKLLLSATSSDIEEKEGLTHQDTNEMKPKKGKEKQKISAKVDKSPMLLDKMNKLNSVLRKLKKERKRKMKKKESFNIAEHISKDPQLKEDMHRIYSMLKDVLQVRSRSVFQEDDESRDGSESFLNLQEEDADYEPNAIDNIIDIFVKMMSTVMNFFGSTSNEACEPQPPINKKKKARRHPMKIDGILRKCKGSCAQVDIEVPRPGISFSYSLDEEEEVEPGPDLLDYIAKELEGLGVPIDTSHSSFSMEEETDDDLTNFMVVGH